MEAVQNDMLLTQTETELMPAAVIFASNILLPLEHIFNLPVHDAKIVMPAKAGIQSKV